MRAVLPTLVLLLATAPVPAADPPPPPVTLAVLDPVTPPQPMPGPATVVQLDAGRGELLQLTGYAGKVRWRTTGTAVVAVTTLRAKQEVWFVGTAPTRQTVPGGGPRVDLVPALKAGAGAPSKHVVGDVPAVLLEPVGPGEATVEADGVDADGFPVTLLSVRVRCGQAPQPPPPDPKPTPPPAPTAPVAFLVVVEETADAVAGRGAFFADPTLAARVKAKGLKWRVVDKDVVGADGKPPADVARFLTAAAGKPYPTLFLVSASGQMIRQQPVPRTPADLLTLLEQYGG